MLKQYTGNVGIASKPAHNPINPTLSNRDFHFSLVLPKFIPRTLESENAELKKNSKLKNPEVPVYV